MTQKARPRYFAAANSADGFVSFFDENLKDRCSRRLIIKGGPGTGKSRLMRELAGAAASAGAETELWLCSSDPASLDGLLITTADGTRLAVQDGTPPHGAEAELPGVRDDLIDLGRFWNSRLLAASGDRIRKLGQQKKEAYASAARCLRAAGELERAAEALLLPFIRTAELEEAAGKTAHDLFGGKAPLRRCALTALGMTGKVSCPGFSGSAERTAAVADSGGWGTEYLFLTAVSRCSGGLCDCGPLLPERVSGILCGGAALIPAPVPGGAVIADTADFTDGRGFAPFAPEYLSLRSLAARAENTALGFLHRAADAHFALEKLYSAAMDFGAKEAFSADLCRELFGRT